MDDARTAKHGGRMADSLDECPYDDNDPLCKKWFDGWDQQWRYRAIAYWTFQYLGANSRNPTVGEAAATFFITAEQVEEVCGGNFLYLIHTDRTLIAQEIDVDGE